MRSCAVGSNTSNAAESTLLNPAFNTTSPTLRRQHSELDGANEDSRSTSIAPNQFAHDFSQIPLRASEGIPFDQIRRQGEPDQGTGGNPPVIPPTVGGIFSCNLSFQDPAQITTAVSTAQSWMGMVVPIVELFQMGALSGDRETAVRIALRENFNITDPFPRFTLSGTTDLDILIANLKLIDAALHQPLQFHCTFACLPGDLAWMLPNPQRFGLPAGIISICPDFFGCDPLKQASTMVHERAHEAIRAQDHAYEVGSDYDSLSTTTALENADSYAVFVRQVYHNGIHRPGLSCSIINSRIPDFHLGEPKLQIPRPRRTLLPPIE